MVCYGFMFEILLGWIIVEVVGFKVFEMVKYYIDVVFVGE